MPTGIQWTDETWNPIRAINKETHEEGWHCELVSPGCTHCYAAFINQKRPFGRGTRLPFVDSSRDKIDIFLDDKTLLEPLRWKKPRRIFVCSMTDLFGDWVSYEWLDKIYAVMALCPQHTFQVLTKRPERMRDYLDADRGEGYTDGYIRLIWGRPRGLGADCVYLPENNISAWKWPLPNVWHGTSVEDQKRADERIPILMECLSSVRFLSCEPLLGEVDIANAMYPPSGAIGCNTFGFTDGFGYEAFIQWVIVGGESGVDARNCTIGHVRRIVKDCQAGGVACFVKQLGKLPVNREGVRHKVTGGHGNKMEEWPADLRVREWPEVRA